MSSWSDAVAAFVRGDHRACLAALQPLLDAQGLQPDRCVLAAHAHAALGDADTGLSLLVRCLDELPRSAPVWLAAAALWAGLGRWQMASRCVDRAAAFAPQSPDLQAMRERAGQGADADSSIPEAWQPLFAVVTSRPTLGACLIVRNEAGRLAECLQSLQGCDAILVVDTGSTDDTVAVAKAAGAQVRQIVWPEDFAAARNMALGYMDADWVLVIDADEALVGGIDAVRATIDAHGSRRTVLCPVVENRADDPAAGTIFRVERCFPRRAGLRYEGRIHEHLVATDGQSLIEWAVDEWRLSHDGYRLAPQARQAKIERNLALLRDWLAEAPGDANAHYYQGLELQAAGDLQGASTALQQAFEMYQDDASKALALLHHLLVLEGAGRSADIVNLGEAYQGLCRSFPDYWLAMGVAYASLGRTMDAMHAFEAVLALPTGVPVTFETAGARTWKPRLYLAQLAASAGDGVAVLRLVEPLMAAYGAHPRIAVLYFYGLVATSRDAEAEAFAVARLSQPLVPDEFVEGVIRVLESQGESAIPYLDRVADMPGAYAVVARRLIERRDWQGLLQHSQRWAAQIGPLACLHQGFAFWELGQTAEAEVAFGQAVSLDPELVLAWHNIGVLAARREDWQTARLAFEGALSIGPSNFPSLVELLDVLAKQGDAEAAKPLLDQARDLMPSHPDLQRLANTLGI